MKGRTIALAVCFCSAGAVDEGVGDWLANCYVWPAVGGVPPEHRDSACDRAKQNALLNSRQLHAESLPKSQLIPDDVYLAIPEEKTYVCPEEESTQITPSTHLGHATRWILSNEASSAIILTLRNPLGLETSAHDHTTFPAHSNTAVYPYGPIVMPGQMAVVNGRMGQTFFAREYMEMAPLDAMYQSSPSWESFKSQLPTTLSFLPTESRYTNRHRVMHVLGQPEGVPQQGEAAASAAIYNYSVFLIHIHKVGCPIDIYFSPEKRNPDFECEVFSKHLGPLEPYLKKGPARDIDGKGSPLFFLNTYNGHTFTAVSLLDYVCVQALRTDTHNRKTSKRMSHDQSLVARIELNHDKVTDCPEPKKVAEGVVPTMEMLPMNSTESLHLNNRWSVAGSQNFTLPALARKASQVKAQPELIHHGSNRTVLVLAS
ncbi:hypothetical protein THAOC_14952 [Thalassiosira oceanica]|uniref:Uncharacterized protein n=1 Tax=Thalassiosira oceanica TaxID=159749 RepID=K0SG55_THAOC|nr:hypothetical protein THAOC_14952 [Thalassiosira oceanica]|eukprot:EJK64325.1 hypothetical protein THAOC_14952 [Thalassiosira oceanica]